MKCKNIQFLSSLLVCRLKSKDVGSNLEPFQSMIFLSFFILFFVYLFVRFVVVVVFMILRII